MKSNNQKAQEYVIRMNRVGLTKEDLLRDYPDWEKQNRGEARSFGDYVEFRINKEERERRKTVYEWMDKGRFDCNNVGERT